MDFLNALKEFFRENPRMWIVVGLAVVLTGGVAWLVYDGASIEFGQFFAAAPFNQCPYVDRNKPECACGAVQTGQTQPNKIVIPHVCTRSYQEGNTDYSDQQWFAWDQQGGSPNCPNGFPYITERTMRNGTRFGTPQACVEKPPDCPDGYHAFSSTFCDQNTVNTPPPATSSPVPTTPVTPTPITSTAPVACSTQTPTIAQGAIATFTATGGNGIFQWNVTGGGIVQSGGNETISISYSIPGTKAVRVNSGTASALCTVVVGGAPTTTPVITGAAMTVQKTARNLLQGDVATVENLTVAPGAVIQFVITVASVVAQPVPNILVQDVVPPGMSYQLGSTYVNGSLIGVDTVTTSGLPLGTLEPAEEFTVRWSAVADRTSQLGPTLQQFQPAVTISASGVAPVTDNVVLQIQGTAAGITPTPLTTSLAGPGGVQTGPGDAVMIALMVSAALTLLYTAYTRSPSFMRKEAEKISRDQGPLDFRT